jgi:hypothetical protein
MSGHPDPMRTLRLRYETAAGVPQLVQASGHRIDGELQRAVALVLAHVLSVERRLEGAAHAVSR